MQRPSLLPLRARARARARRRECGSGAEGEGDGSGGGLWRHLRRCDFAPPLYNIRIPKDGGLIDSA